MIELLLYAYLGALLSILIETTRRDVNSERTPRPFIFKVFFEDNWKKLLLSIIIIFLSVKFYPEITIVHSVLGNVLKPYTAVGIGFSHDKVAQWLRDKFNLGIQKD